MGTVFIQTTSVETAQKIGAMDRRKNDVPTEIFSQGLENPLARERENPLQIFSQERKNPAEIQTFR